MGFDSAAVTSLFASLVSHAQNQGLFEDVAGHEPRISPGSGLNCAIWVQSITPAGRASGAASVSGRVEFNVRVYSSAVKEPLDLIDPEILTAVSALIGEYSGNFTLGGTVRAVDLLGMYGTPLSAQAGYLNQDGKLFRVMVITLPVIVNDMWTEVA